MIVHKFTGNSYYSKRDDGKLVPMVQIACQKTRVELPRGHDRNSGESYINCRECLLVMREKTVKTIEVIDIRLMCARSVAGIKFRKPLKHKNTDRGYVYNDELVERLAQ